MKHVSLKSFKRNASKSKRRVPGKVRRPINVLASCLTVMSLYSGMASIFAAIGGNYEKAAYWILGAIIFDSLDGSVAKLTKSVSEFGKQLDSLCDLVSFGAAPAVLIFTAYIDTNAQMGPLVSRLGAIMAGFFVICGALRLARFNTWQADSRDYFTGLPIPAAGGLVASFVIFAHHFELTVTIWLLGPLTIALALLMVSTIRYPKDKIKSALLSPKHAFRFILLAGVLIAFLGAASEHSPAVALFPMGAGYVLLGFGNHLYEMILRHRNGDALPVQSPKPGPATSSTKSDEVR